MTTILKINSKDRVSGSNTDFTFNTTHLNPSKITLKEVYIPNLFYNIRANDNNVFSYQYNSVPGTVTVAPGFYTTAELLTAIEAGLTTNGLPNITLTQDPNTRLINLANAEALTFRIENEADGNVMADNLGIFTSIDVLTATNRDFDAQPNMLSYMSLNVLSKKLTNGFNVIQSDKQRHPILATIPLATTAFNSLLHYQPSEQHNIHMNHSYNIQDVDIKITDEEFNDVTLPFNVDVIIVLELE